MDMIFRLLVITIFQVSIIAMVVTMDSAVADVLPPVFSSSFFIANLLLLQVRTQLC